ncbi:hypothetical protein BH11PSE14_BH11PSE14_12390 [soil metagenome]
MDPSQLPAPLRQKLEARLAALPLQYRAVVGARLAQLPPEQLEKMLAKSSPLLDRMIDKIDLISRASRGASGRGGSAGANSAGPDSDVAGSASAGSSSAGAGSIGGGSVVGGPTRRVSAALIPGAKTHYNTTVQRGDSPMPSMGALLIVLLGLAAIAWNLGWLVI